MTRIMKCSCDHKFQDEKYGKGNRVCNQTMKDDKRTYRCTICEKESR